MEYISNPYTVVISSTSTDLPEVYTIDSIQYQKILGILARSVNYDLIITHSLTAVNIPLQHAQVICNEVYNYNAVSTLAHYLTAKSISQNQLDNSNIFAILSGSGINHRFLKWLAAYTWDTTPSMGKGEVFIASMVDRARRADRSLGEKGDIILQNTELEIKGEGSRLKGFTGYGQGIDSGNYWHNYFSSYLDLHEFLPKIGGTDWNLVKTGFAVDILGQKLLRLETTFTINQLIQIWKDGLKKLYLHSTDSDLYFIDESYKDGVLDRKHIQNGLLLFSLEYYFKVEKINQLLLGKFTTNIDEEDPRYGKTVIITTDDIRSGQALQKISKYSLPNFSSASGSQGAAVALFV